MIAHARVVLATVVMLAISGLPCAASQPRYTLIPGSLRAGSEPDGNTIILDAPDGLVVVDTGRHPEHQERILAFARESKKPIVAIINSHWHLDHVGGNLMLRAEYPQVRVYASGALDAALGGFLANYRRQLEQAIAASKDAAAQDAYRTEIALIDAGPRLGPTDVVTRSATRVIAGRRLEFHLEQAATAGDVWVFDRSSRTLLAGDLVTLPAPFFDTACPEHWQSALDRLARVKFRKLIPGHGRPMVRAGFETYRAAFNALLTCAAGDQPKATCIDGWLKDAGDLIPESDRDYARGLIDYYVDQLLRGHSAKVEELCRDA